MLLIRNVVRAPVRDLEAYPSFGATFLFTRFNVPIPEYRQRLAEAGIDYGAWLRSKRDAFLRYCLPSVLAQSRKDFVWLIGFGERTPEVDEIIAACASHDFIRPVFLAGGGRRLVEAIRTEYAAIAPGGAGGPGGHVMTVRLDCDDALNIHFFYNMQVAARAAIAEGGNGAVERGKALCFPFGAKLSGGRWCPTVWQQNPFLGFLEPGNRPLQTVFARAHGKIHEVAEAREIHTLQPMWLQVVDQDNVMNRLERREGPVMPVTPELLEMFAIRSAGGAA